MLTATNPLQVTRYQDLTVVKFIETSILDTLAAQTMGKDLFKLVDEDRCRRIVLDFSSVQFLSSSMIGVLLVLANKARTIDGSVVILGMRPQMREMLELTKPDKLLKFADTRTGAFRVLDVYIAH